MKFLSKAIGTCFLEHGVDIFKLVRFFDHRMMPWNFRDDISNGSGVIVLTDRQTNTQTDTTENNSTLAARVIVTP